MSALNRDFVIRILVTSGDGSIQPRYWDGHSKYTTWIAKAHVYPTREKVEKAIKARKAKLNNDSLGYMTKEEAEAEALTLAESNAGRIALKREEMARKEAERRAEIAKGPKPEAILSWLQGNKQSCEKDLKAWAEKFGINPAYALEWVDSQFTNAAMLSLCHKYIKILEWHLEKGTDSQKVTDEIMANVQDDFVFMAGTSSHRSTSQGTNMLEDAKVTVHAKFHKWLRGI